ncbi:hypothetical protein DCE79_00800 [Lysinibacillus sp. 2017]|uniref:DUF2691 family protein n=1 Tax=unclassified Lysinibacillus TaxID=2636778 RepID=UPI000D5290DC|nr:MULTISPECIES: DUF2691 family protein [unclassified Lysinibacillus]AWE06035.1 hypothetical protein DCE79_00800 [Lysinibacillus sp. 2017]TGN34818.1 DUF2691 family protein [Lysinibacillus sp. S2017]
MKKIGINFFVNDTIHTDFLLSDILLNMIDLSWYWVRGGGENYQVEGEDYNKILTPLFNDEEVVLTGEKFIERITTTKHYVITADFKAFPTKEDIVKILDYQDFENSSCQLAIIILDTGYVSVYLKDEPIIKGFMEKAKKNGFSNINIIVADSSNPNPSLTT